MQPLWKYTLIPLRRTKQSDVVPPETVTDAHKKGFADGFLAAIEQIESVQFSMYGTQGDGTQQAMEGTRNTLVSILRSTHNLWTKDSQNAKTS